jgi:hypothetical protein
MRKFFKGFKWTVLIAGAWYLVVGPSTPPVPHGTDPHAVAAEIRQFALGPRHGPADILP